MGEGAGTKDADDYNAATIMSHHSGGRLIPTNPNMWHEICGFRRQRSGGNVENGGKKGGARLVFQGAKEEEQGG